jgi:hypothetical protein
VLKGFSLVLVVCALVPAAAQANDYYVSQSGSGTACTSSSTPCDLSTALGQADAAPGSNTVHITGPLTLSGLPPMLVGSAGPGSTVSLVGSGSGSGGTSLSGGAPALVVGPGSSVSHMALTSPSVPLASIFGGSVDDVVATSTGTSGPAMVVVPPPFSTPGGTTISHSVLSTPSDSTAPTLATTGNATDRTTVSDSKITGADGVQDIPTPVPGTKGVRVVRSLLDVTNYGVNLSGGSAEISDSVIHLSSPAGQAVILPGIFPFATHVDLLQDTIVGPGSGTGSGVYLPAAQTGAIAASATVTGSIVRGFGTDLDVVPAGPTFTSGSASATYSDLDQASTGQGNVVVDPSFTNAGAGDYSLTPGSPLIDAAGTDPANGETDVLGNPRVVDGNGDGTAARDIGAYEFQPPPAPPAPPAAPSAPPKPRTATLKLKLPHGILTLGAGRIVLFNIGCPAGQNFGCRVTVTLQGAVKSARTKTIKLGTGHAIIAAGKRANVRVKLTRKAAALIKAGKLRRVTAVVFGKDASGAAGKRGHSYRIRYKAPRHHHR